MQEKIEKKKEEEEEEKKNERKKTNDSLNYVDDYARVKLGCSEGR